MLKLYETACKKGNSDCIVACNEGIFDELINNYANEDYVCGEFNDFVCIPKSKYIDGAQAHILAPLGCLSSEEEWSGWGQPGARRTKEYMLDYVQKVNAAGGAVTIDICVNRDGSFDKTQFDMLKYISDNLNREMSYEKVTIPANTH